ncbi:MAG: hypothetical protein V3S17_01740, partial [candidate division Zixibacteria bacterium]
NGFALLEIDSKRIYLSYDVSKTSVAAFVLPDTLRLAGKIEINNQTAQAFPVISAYWFAWVSFFPETELLK